MPVHSAVARMARGLVVSLIAGVVVLAIGALILPSWWVALILAVIAYATNMWLEYRADRPVFNRYTELIVRLRQQQPW